MLLFPSCLNHTFSTGTTNYTIELINKEKALTRNVTRLYSETSVKFCRIKRHYYPYNISVRGAV
jgi:hypothetical protein